MVQASSSIPSMLLWGQPSERECQLAAEVRDNPHGTEPIHVHMVTLLSFCDVLSAAKDHVIHHPKM